MNNFNPNFFNSLNMTRSISPFSTAGSSTINGLTNTAKTGGLFSRIGGSKMTLSGILNGAQKTIGTVNQIVPLYNQVKPMFQNSKALINVVKGLKNDTNTTNKRSFQIKRRNKQFSHNNTITIDPKPTNAQKKEKIRPDQPSKPYFL